MVFRKQIVFFALFVTCFCACTWFYVKRSYTPNVLAVIENYRFTKEVFDELITPENRHLFVFEPNYNIITFPNVLSKDQCEGLMAEAKLIQAPSELSYANPDRDDIRKSMTSWIDSSPIDDYITEWIIQYLRPYFPRVSKNWMERLQVVEYEPGGKFLEHWDNAWRVENSVENPRLVTFLFYLNDDYDGGETIFPLLKRGVKGQQGMGLVFYNIDPYSKLIIAESLHIGNRVRKGRKWIATKWVHVSEIKDEK